MRLFFRDLESRRPYGPLTPTPHGCRFPDTPSFSMKSIPVLTLYDRIASNMRRDYQLQKSLRLREEAARLAAQSRKKAAGRVYERSQDEWAEAYRSIATYEEKRQFNDINAPRLKLKRLTRRKF